MDSNLLPEKKEIIFKIPPCLKHEMENEFNINVTILYVTRRILLRMSACCKPLTIEYSWLQDNKYGMVFGITKLLW